MRGEHPRVAGGGTRRRAMTRCCRARDDDDDDALARARGGARDVERGRAGNDRRDGDSVTPSAAIRGRGAAGADDDEDDERSTTTSVNDGDDDVVVRIADDDDGDDDDGVRTTTGRRSAWDRAAGTTSDDGRSERSATHSTFGRHRRQRKVSRAVERALGGAHALDEDEDDEYAPTRARAADAGDEEAGFGFVSKGDIARRDAERAAKAKAKAEAKAKADAERLSALKAADELAKRKAATSDDDETMSLLAATDGDDSNANERRNRRGKSGKKMSLLAYTAIASCAVIAACVGIVIYVPAPTSSVAVPASSASTSALTVDGSPVLTSSSSSVDDKNDIAADLEKKLVSRSRSKRAEADAVDDDEDDDEDGASSTKSKKKSIKSSSSKSPTKDLEEDEYDEETADEDEEDDKTAKADRDSRTVEARLGRFAWVDDDKAADKAKIDENDMLIRATRACAPIHVETRHGVYRQFNHECLLSDDGIIEKPVGCMRDSADGCQSCYVANSAAASQQKSYAWCSQHVCETYGATGCEPVHRNLSSGGKKKEEPSRKKKKPTPFASATAARDVEACLPNLEDAKRGIFQYSAHHCRTMGHAHVDYSGCVSIGKSSCRMCVTKSTMQGTVFSLCPKSVCEHHDLLYSQCDDDDDE